MRHYEDSNPLSPVLSFLCLAYFAVREPSLLVVYLTSSMHMQGCCALPRFLRVSFLCHFSLGKAEHLAHSLQFAEAQGVCAAMSNMDVEEDCEGGSLDLEAESYQKGEGAPSHARSDWDATCDHIQPALSASSKRPCDQELEVESARFAEVNVESKNAGLVDVRRSLFNEKKKQILEENISRVCSGSKSLVDVSAKASLPILSLSQISFTNQRFGFEGKVLNVYGTYNTDKNYKRFLRTDLSDKDGVGTVTLVFGPDLFRKFEDKIVVGTCIRVEGVLVAPRTSNDGGSIDYSLHADATTCVSSIPTFDVCLILLPELSIRGFLKKFASNSALKSTIAFVIVQVDHVQKSEGGLFEQLTIADGPLPTDRATLTFVSKRKALYYQLVDEFHKGNVVPYLARNIGAWKEKSNTLSVLDVTLIVPLYGERRKKHLLEVFHSQISEQGYGKEIFGVLTITNFNGSLTVKKCRTCRGQHISSLPDGGFCYSCGKAVQVDEVVRLLGEVKQETCVSEVILSSPACDSVLRFEEPLLQLYKKDGILTRVRLSEVEVEGYFVVDTQGQIFRFRSK